MHTTNPATLPSGAPSSNINVNGDSISGGSERTKQGTSTSNNVSTNSEPYLLFSLAVLLLVLAFL